MKLTAILTLICASAAFGATAALMAGDDAPMPRLPSRAGRTAAPRPADFNETFLVQSLTIGEDGAWMWLKNDAARYRFFVRSWNVANLSTLRPGVRLKGRYRNGMRPFIELLTDEGKMKVARCQTEQAQALP